MPVRQARWESRALLLLTRGPLRPAAEEHQRTLPPLEQRRSAV